MDKQKELLEIQNILKFIQNFSKKQDVDIQSDIDKMQELFDMKYNELEEKLKKLLSIEVNKESSSNISNNLLKDTVFKFKVVDFIMKFYELLSLTKIKFSQYTEKNLSREMFLDSMNFQILDEYKEWLQSLEKESKSMDSVENMNQLEDHLSQTKSGNQENDIKDKSNETSNSEIEVKKELIATENVLIDRDTLLNPKFNQIDILIMVKELNEENLMLDLNEPLILSLTFNCSIFKDAKIINFAKESNLLKNKILNSKSSKKNKFRSHKNLTKISKSLSSGKKPSPFKFQTDITHHFKKKKFSGTKKNLGLKKLKMQATSKITTPFLHTPQLINNHFKPLHPEPPKIIKSSKIMVNHHFTA
jgi:hypothetical protein